MSFGMLHKGCLSPSPPPKPAEPHRQSHKWEAKTLLPLTNQLMHKAAMSNYGRRKLKLQIAV